MILLNICIVFQFHFSEFQRMYPSIYTFCHFWETLLLFPHFLSRYWPLLLYEYVFMHLFYIQIFPTLINPCSSPSISYMILSELALFPFSLLLYFLWIFMLLYFSETQVFISVHFSYLIFIGIYSSSDFVFFP